MAPRPLVTIEASTGPRCPRRRVCGSRMQLGARARADLEISTRFVPSACRPGSDQRLTVRTGTPTGPRIFDGLVFNVDDEPLGAPGVGTVTKLQAVDDWSTASQRRVSKTYTVGQTLKAIVADVVTTYLAVFSITLDPTMPAGPTLGEVSFDAVTVEETFQRLSTLSAWVYRLRPDNVVEWFTIGSKMRAITLSAANKNILGAIRWSKTRGQFVNKVILRYGTGLVTIADRRWVTTWFQIRIRGPTVGISAGHRRPAIRGVGSAAVGYPCGMTPREQLCEISARHSGPAAPAPGDSIRPAIGPISLTSGATQAATNRGDGRRGGTSRHGAGAAAAVCPQDGPPPRRCSCGRVRRGFLPGDTLGPCPRALPNAVWP